MMHSVFGVHTPGPLPLSYPHDTFLSDVSNQMAVSQATRRLSRGSSGQRSGSAMRVSKPSSASNSPRSSTMINRRRTMISDGPMLRRPQAMDFLATARNDMGQPTQRPARPVSWHPSTYLQPPQPQFQQAPPAYPLSTPNMYADQRDSYFSQPQFSPMMTSYSNNTSPSSTFSPLPLGYSAVEPSQYAAPDGWDLPQKPTQQYSASNDYQGVPEMFPSLNTQREQYIPPTNGMDWNTFIMHGFNNTSPPTPETFLQPQQSQPAVSEDAVPYQPLEEAEEEGEILVGMGLYDTPEKCGEDPQLNNYRTTVSSLLGSTFRHTEPSGKGLKLEETWEPPKSDDEEDEGSDDESDEE